MSSAKQSVKRALALSTGAVLSVGALAFVAPAANAADSVFTVGTIGPVRDAGTVGGLVVVKTDYAGAIATPANIRLGAFDYSSNDENIPGVQAVAYAAVNPRTVVPSGSPLDTVPGDGLAEIHLRVTGDVTNVGDSIKYSVWYDADGGNDFDVNEPRFQVTAGTTGIPTGIDITPQLQNAPEGVDSNPFTATIRDSAGRITQLTAGEQFNLGSAPALDNISTPDGNAVIDPAETLTGVTTFTARDTTSGTYVITAASAGTLPAGINDTATLTVVEDAILTNNEIDVVTGADSWFGLGNPGGVFNPVSVRVDQTSITLNFETNDPNETVHIIATGDPVNGPRFGGAASKTYETVLDAAGKGSIVITPDAATINEDSVITLTGRSLTGPGAAGAKTVNFDRAQVNSATLDATTYISKVGGAVQVTATALDQFRNPAPAGSQVGLQRLTGLNSGPAVIRQTVDAAGKTTFTLTDTQATATVRTPSTGLQVTTWTDQFDNTANSTVNTGTIIYTVDGLGDDITFNVNGVAVDGVGYNPASITVPPLYDGVANLTGERIALVLAGGTAGAAATISADNGALILKNPTVGTRALANGAASQSTIIGNGDTFQLIGTKGGLVNITVTTGGKTKTAAVTVAPIPNTGAQFARNVAVTGPASAKAGSLAVFTAKFTDAFGNPAVGFGNPVTGNNVNVQVTGPGSVQDMEQLTDANGEIKINVRLANNADAPVTLKVTGFGAQMGAAANNTVATVSSNDGPGLTASVTSAQATIGDVKPALTVEEAQAAVDAAKATLAAANADLNTTQAQKRAAQQQLNKAVRTLKQAQKALKKAKKAKKGIAKAKQKVNRAKRAVNTERRQNAAAAAAVKAANVKVNNAKANVAKAEADLAEAQS
ncbi:hypothetical protein [Nocardioides sp. R-C-SC26]|uniref:beta strand repeat-containing protein n=1 Tax=Nocardioides sp. R-C-SC26 TaxID=2870414 RepID=UPI001E2D268C|nr:hypothetical protein [Nocardioides sp. R-C-SC26]